MPGNNCQDCAPGFQLPECKECKPGYIPPYCIECMDGFNRYGSECVSSCSDTHFMPTNCTECIEPYAPPDCRCTHGYIGNNCDECE